MQPPEPPAPQACSVGRVGTPEELALALEIRRHVFVHEQRIPLDEDQDGLDPEAGHVLVWVEGAAVATGRVVLRGDRAVAGRVAVLHDHRGQGLGRVVVRALEALAAERGARSISLHPHLHLERFYHSLGYRRVGGTRTVGPHLLITMRRAL